MLASWRSDLIVSCKFTSLRRWKDVPVTYKNISTCRWKRAISVSAIADTENCIIQRCQLGGAAEDLATLSIAVSSWSSSCFLDISPGDPRPPCRYRAFEMQDNSLSVSRPTPTSCGSLPPTYSACICWNIFVWGNSVSSSHTTKRERLGFRLGMRL